MPQNLRILGLDLGTNCGWSHTCGESGTFDLRVKKDESSGMKLIRFRSKLEDIRKGVGVDVIVFEQTIVFAKHSGAESQAELQGVLKLWCMDNHVENKSYPISVIKKFATGKGNAKKEQMIEAANRKWNREFTLKDNNQVDALWILELAKSDLSLG